MTAIAHRPLQPSDAQQVCSFVLSAEELFFCFPKAGFPLAPEQFLAEARRRQAPTVALEDQRVVGYADFVEVRPKRFCALGNLVVDPNRRRQGIGRYLVETMAALALDAHQAKFVTVSCFSHNTAAYGLYHALGFKPDKMKPRTSPDGESVLLVDLILRTSPR